MSFIIFLSYFFFFFNDPATTEIYTLSLHDALPISRCHRPADSSVGAGRRRRRSEQGLGMIPHRSRSRRSRSPWHRDVRPPDRKSTRLNSSHQIISYAVFCLKKKKKTKKYKIRPEIS